MSVAEKNSKVASVANFIPSKFWSLSQGVLEVLCSHCPIKDSSGCFTLSFTFQLCYKPLGKLQMVTKSQKVHISTDDGLPNFTISTLLKIGSGFPKVAGIRSSLKKVLNLSRNRSFILWMQSIHNVNIYKKPSFPMRVSLIVLATITLT